MVMLTSLVYSTREFLERRAELYAMYRILPRLLPPEFSFILMIS